MIRKRVIIGLRGASPDDIIAAATRSGWLPDRAPDAGTIDEMLTWGDPDDPIASISYSLGCTLLGATRELDRDALLDGIAALPFDLAVVRTLYPEWRTQLGYHAPSFSEGLPPLGWLCAFRGVGHDRLVSRRWLTQELWTVHAKPVDLSLVEFHDLHADAATALAQARPAHQRMGITDEGGFVQTGFVYRQLPTGFYVAARAVLEVVIHGRSLEPRELLEACAVRNDPAVTQPDPIANVAYVFVQEAEARANLHELWLRGLECWTLREGNKVRLDDTYVP
jgi:hypothetical protein